MKKSVPIAILGLALLLNPLSASSQERDDEQSGKRKIDIAEMKKLAPKVFIDFEDGDQDYIRTEILFVNYVRDRKEADVHVLVTTQDTGSGGTEYTLAFIGQGSCAAINCTLIYASQKTDTEEEVRRGYVTVLKMGLIPYASRTPIRDMISVDFKQKVNPTDVVDTWDFWVFSAGVGGEINRESQTKSDSINFSFSANRITPESKILLGLASYFTNEKFQYGEGWIESRAEQIDFSGLYVKSLGEHWSAGLMLTAASSTFRNMKSKITPSPAVEFNLFPYAESTRRQLRFLYRVGCEFARYREETIYDKTRESLFGQALSVTLEIKEPWGSLSSSLEGSHYFHDLRYNRLILMAELSFRIVKGLDLNIDGTYERVRDQLSLAKGGASLEEILLRRRELATNYNLYLSVNLSFTFGSIYSNVVNPRFGSLGALNHHMEGWD